MTKEIKYRKLGGGSLRIGRRIIKQGQVFSCNPDLLSEGILMYLEVVGKVSTAKKSKEIVENIEKRDYILYAFGKGWYGIKDNNGKLISEKKMRRSDAEEMLHSLK